MSKGIDQPVLIRELKGEELRTTAIKMLTGQKGRDFAYYEGDKQYWALRLEIRRN